MSAPTPGTSAPTPEGSTPAATAQDGVQDPTAVDRVVLEYLRSRGHKAAERALLDALEGDEPMIDGSGISPEDFIRRLAVFLQKPSQPGHNALKDGTPASQELNALENPQSIKDLLKSLGPIGAEEILSADPMDKQQGFRELEAWVDGSLDMYRVCSPRNIALCTLTSECSQNSALFSSQSSCTSILT
jgi:transcription initiation factor TFIID subunit 5